MASVGSGNEAWKIEMHGIDVIPDEEKNGKPLDLFWVWFAANIGIVEVVYGGRVCQYFCVNSLREFIS